MLTTKFTTRQGEEITRTTFFQTVVGEYGLFPVDTFLSVAHLLRDTKRVLCLNYQTWVSNTQTTSGRLRGDPDSSAGFINIAGQHPVWVQGKFDLEVFANGGLRKGGPSLAPVTLDAVRAEVDRRQEIQIRSERSAHVH